MKQWKNSEFEKIFRDRKPGLITKYRYNSVLVPLVEKDGETHILYEVRSDDLKRQPGEICFPGGKLEDGETLAECAARETAEELNIDLPDIRLISEIGYMHTYSNFAMHAFLGTIDYEVVSKPHPNAAEVKDIFLAPVSFFLENEPTVYCFDVSPEVSPDFPYEKIGSTKSYNWRKGVTHVAIYDYEGRAIWGLTARITKYLVDIIREAGI